jgi:two-component system sensor histidine kinase BaeS
MTRIRWKLLTAMVTVVVVTIALSGIFTTRVTHDEVRRLIVSKPNAPGAGKDVIVVDRSGKIVSTSPGLRGATIHIAGDRVEVTTNRNGHLMQLVLFVAPTPIPGTTSRAYFLPHESPPPELTTLDRRLILTFAIAIIVAVFFTFLISRHITRPIEQLTGAVQEMARGKAPARVAARGRDEIAQLAMSFNAMADAIASQQELRKRMVGDVAHELRTPVTNLRCELESIQDGLAIPDEPRIASLHEEVLHLQHLIDDLQELAVADAGGMKLRRERIDLAAVIEQIAGTFRAVVVVETRPVVFADPLRIGQIMRNLLTNAASVGQAPSPDRTGGTGEGACPTQIVVRSEGGHAIVSVIDHGPGIPPAELENIFERFYRLDPSRTRDDGGAGLGLAIVRRLVELHGGRVWAEIMPDAGAAFTFTIPSYDAATLGA